MVFNATGKDGRPYEASGHDWAYEWSGSDCRSTFAAGFGRFQLDWSKVTSANLLEDKAIPPDLAPVPVIGGKPQPPEPSKSALDIRGTEGLLTVMEGRMPLEGKVVAIRIERQTPIPTEIRDKIWRLAVTCRPPGTVGN